ncbi:hypothetical protein BDZ94DRAFT_1278576 [Collybia nuda]|uniref:Uncharacterized protein n=1 Tax=Collybia nuda TaxID=64659 RepID=A0A9P6C7U8_9AGAR|nr:hypothetical protein BDZ94DRAFT_1278576 [Collybia nuda]
MTSWSYLVHHVVAFTSAIFPSINGEERGSALTRSQVSVGPTDMWQTDLYAKRVQVLSCYYTFLYTSIGLGLRTKASTSGPNTFPSTIYGPISI